MRLFLAGFGALLLGGCGTTPPALSGGKPVSYWIRALKGPDPHLRKKAAFKLGNVGPADAAVFPALVEALKDDDAPVRCEVILALLKFGPEAKKAVPALTELALQDSDDQVRTYAAKALARIQG